MSSIIGKFKSKEGHKAVLSLRAKHPQYVVVIEKADGGSNKLQFILKHDAYCRLRTLGYEEVLSFD